MRLSGFPYFFTATILEWKHLLKPDQFKNIITGSLQLLVTDKRIIVYGFVVMSNHIHIIWQVEDTYDLDDVQLSFMKYTAQMMLKELRNNHPKVLDMFKVKAADRKYQIWERNPLSVSLWNRSVFEQKLDYIHYNPVRANLVFLPEDYRYSSAAFYMSGNSEWNFLSHYNG